MKMKREAQKDNHLPQVTQLERGGMGPDLEPRAQSSNIHAATPLISLG